MGRKNILSEKLNIIRKKLTQTGFFHIFGSSTINKIIGFASSWILVRIISKPEYGVYSYANNIYSFCLLLSGWGITSAVLQLCSESNDEDRRSILYRYGMRFGLKVNLALAILVACIGCLIPLPIEGSNVLLTMMCALPTATLIPELQFLYLRFNMRNKEYAKANTFNSIIVFAFSCIFAFLWKAPGLVLAGYAAHLTTSVYAAKKYGAPVDCRKVQLNQDDKKTLFSIATISMINNGLSRLMYLLDVFVLGIVVPDSTAIAAYSVATKIPTAMGFIPSAVTIYIYPYFARHKDDRHWLLENYVKLIIPFGLFNLCASAALVLFAKPMISILFGAQYLDAVVPFRILSISYFFSATFRVVSGNLLVTQRKLKFNLVMAVLSSTLNTVLNVFFISAWASEGAALATLLTVVVSCIASTLYLLHVFKNVK